MNEADGSYQTDNSMQDAETIQSGTTGLPEIPAQVHSIVTSAPENEYGRLIRNPTVAKKLTDDIAGFRKEFVKESCGSLPPADNRLLYIGSHYPPGYEPSEIEDPCWDFGQDIIDSTSMADVPVTLEHDPSVEIGAIRWHMKDTRTGRQYHYGYIDDNSEKGKDAISRIESGQLRGLSVQNGALLVKVPTDSKLKQVFYPHNVSIVEEGKKPGSRILGYHKIDLKKMREEKRQKERMQQDQTQPPEVPQTIQQKQENGTQATGNEAPPQTESDHIRLAGNDDEEDVPLTKESLESITEALKVISGVPEDVQSAVHRSLANLIKDNKASKHEANNVLKQFMDVKRKYEDLRDIQDNDTSSIFKDMEGWLKKHGELDPVVLASVQKVIQAMPPVDKKNVQVLFKSVRAAGAAADNSRHVSETDDFMKSRGHTGYKMDKKYIEHTLGLNGKNSGGVSSRFTRPTPYISRTGPPQQDDPAEKKKKKETYADAMKKLQAGGASAMSDEQTKRLGDMLTSRGNAFHE